MLSWGSYYFFPLAFERVDADRAYQTEHTQNGAADFFDALADTPTWRFNLSGLKILADYIDEWDAFHDAVRGQWKPFLFRLGSRRFEILQNQPGGIGTGNGVQTQFQLVKTRVYPNGPANKSIEIVRFPHHQYPPIKARRASGGDIVFYPTESVRVWINGVELSPTAFTVERESGLLTFANAPANGALIQASCKFWVPVHGQDFYPSSNEGGSWVFGQGAMLFQVESEL